MLVGPRFYARTYVAGMISYMVMLTVFALVAQPITAATALVLTGLGGAAFSIMQATLVYARGAAGDAQPRCWACCRSASASGRSASCTGAAGGRDRRTLGDRDDGVEGLAALALTWKLWRVLVRP